MDLVEKITKTTEISAIEYKLLYFNNLYLFFHHFSVLLVDLVGVHEVLRHYQWLLRIAEDAEQVNTQNYG